MTVHCICRSQTSPLLHRKSLSLSKRWGVSLAPPPIFRPTELNVTRPLQMKSLYSIQWLPLLPNLSCQLQSPPASLEHPHFHCVLCVFVPCPCVRCAMSWCGVATHLGRLLRVYSMTPGCTLVPQGQHDKLTTYILLDFPLSLLPPTLRA